MCVNQYLVEIVGCLLNVGQNPYHIAGGTAELMRECKSCTLIRRKPRNRIIDDSGREMKKCTHCGNYFYLNRFYNRIVVRKGKEYHLLTSWCRMCMSQINNQRAKKKK